MKNSFSFMKSLSLLLLLSIFTNIQAQNLLLEQHSNSLLKKESQRSIDYFDFGSRHSNSMIFSILLPGAGQTYFGHEIKGAAISISYFGSVVTAILANNNFKAREERIEILTQDYLKADKFSTAEKIWNDIQTEINNREINERNRTLFTITAAAIWVYGIVDLIYFTDDQGDTSFALKDNSPIQISTQITGDFTGIALKLNLP